MFPIFFEDVLNDMIFISIVKFQNDWHNHTNINILKIL